MLTVFFEKFFLVCQMFLRKINMEFFVGFRDRGTVTHDQFEPPDKCVFLTKQFDNCFPLAISSNDFSLVVLKPINCILVCPSLMYLSKYLLLSFIGDKDVPIPCTF